MAPLSPSGIEIRAADPGRDAAGCAAIYAPFVESTAVSFEEPPFTVERMEARMRELGLSYLSLAGCERRGRCDGLRLRL